MKGLARHANAGVGRSRLRAQAVGSTYFKDLVGMPLPSAKARRAARAATRWQSRPPLAPYLRPAVPLKGAQRD